jgi:hypothetical protein
MSQLYEAAHASASARYQEILSYTGWRNSRGEARDAFVAGLRVQTSSGGALSVKNLLDALIEDTTPATEELREDMAAMQGIHVGFHIIPYSIAQEESLMMGSGYTPAGHLDHPNLQTMFLVPADRTHHKTRDLMRFQGLSPELAQLGLYVIYLRHKPSISLPFGSAEMNGPAAIPSTVSSLFMAWTWM